MALQLVREVWKNAATGESGERWIELDVRTPEEQALIDQQRAATAAMEAGNELTLRQRADLALGTLEVEAARDYTGLTAAQALQFLVPTVKLLCKVCIALVRLTLRKLDSVAGTAQAGGKG